MKEQKNDIELKKTCCKCKTPKSLDQFNKAKRNKDGLQYKCKSCEKEYFDNNKEKHNQQTRDWYKENKIKHKKNCRKWVMENKERFNAKVKEWQAKNPGYSAKKAKKHYDNNPQYKLSQLLRIRLVDVLRGKIKKSEKTEILLGCSFESCKKHLESLFKPEMTWSNHGTIWEIDHIKPCSKFDLTDIGQQKICFHYTNLQPLFKTSDIAKSFGYINEIGNRNKSDKEI